jgi:hypothetical protein
MTVREITDAYTDIMMWFAAFGYLYGVDYRFEWEDAESMIPDYVWCDEDMAVLFSLKYGTITRD